MSNPELYTKGKTCTYCGKVNHVASQCLAKKRAQHKGRKPMRTNGQPQANVGSAQLFVTSTTTPGNSSIWYLDSGATQHMTSSTASISTFKWTKPVKVYLGDNRFVISEGSGTIALKMLLPENADIPAILTDVLYVPQLMKNLFSVSRATSQGCSVTFNNDQCIIKNATNLTVGIAVLNNGLYVLQCEQTQHETSLSNAPGAKKEQSTADFASLLPNMTVTPAPISNGMTSTSMLASTSSPSSAILWHN